MRQERVGRSVGYQPGIAVGIARAWRGVVRGAVALVLAVVAWALIATGGALPGLSNLAAQVVYACGLGTGPTMMANSDPALLHPLPVGANVAATQPLGQFSSQFVVNSPINFAEDLSRAPNAPSNLQIIWNFGDGSKPVTSNTPTHTFAKPGTYNIQTQLAGSDNGAGNGAVSWTNFENDFDSASITVVAQTYSTPPIATAHASTSIINQGGSVTFDATGSHSQDGSPVKYLWNFNDGQTSTQAQVTHEFGVIGNGLVTLTVTDGRGASTVATLVIVISSASLASNVTSAPAGGTVSFNAATNVGTPAAAQTGGLAPSYAWSFGDGTPSQNTTSPTINHTFAKPGQYAVAVQEIAGQSVNAVEAEMVTVTATAPAKPSGGIQFKSWEIYAVVGIVILAILLTMLSNVRAERRRARAIIAAKTRRAATMARGRGDARMDRYDDRGSARRRSPREMEYSKHDERGPGRGGRRSAGDHDPRRGGPAQARSRRSDRSRGDDW